MAFGCRMQVRMGNGSVVTLAPFERADMAQIVEGVQCYSNLKWLSLRDAQTLESEQAWYERVSTATDEVAFGVWISGPHLIGCFSLMHIADKRATAGAVMYAQDQQEKGIGTAVTRAALHYAVNVLDMVAIDSDVLSMNERSRRMQESVGFVQTGARLQAAVVDGKLCDMQQLLWVNPRDHAWDYFWRDRPEPETFIDAREKSQAALDWAEEHVTYL